MSEPWYSARHRIQEAIDKGDRKEARAWQKLCDVEDARLHMTAAKEKMEASMASKREAERIAGLPFPNKSPAGRKMLAAMTAEQRKAWIARKREEWAERNRKISESCKLREARKTPEERAEHVRKAQATRDRTIAARQASDPVRQQTSVYRRHQAKKAVE